MGVALHYAVFDLQPNPEYAAHGFGCAVRPWAGADGLGMYACVKAVGVSGMEAADCETLMNGKARNNKRHEAKKLNTARIFCHRFVFTKPVRKLD